MKFLFLTNKYSHQLKENRRLIVNK